MISRLLFKLHIINNLTIKRDRDGKALVTLHRTDDKSSDIRPQLEKALADPNAQIHITFKERDHV